MEVTRLPILLWITELEPRDLTPIFGLEKCTLSLLVEVAPKSSLRPVILLNLSIYFEWSIVGNPGLLLLFEPPRFPIYGPRVALKTPLERFGCIIGLPNLTD